MKNFMLILCIRCWYSVSGSDTLYQDLIPRIRFQCITFWRILQKMKNFMLILCIRCWYSVSGADTRIRVWYLVSRSDTPYQVECITFGRILQKVEISKCQDKETVLGQGKCIRTRKLYQGKVRAPGRGMCTVFCISKKGWKYQTSNWLKECQTKLEVNFKISNWWFPDPLSIRHKSEQQMLHQVPDWRV